MEHLITLLPALRRRSGMTQAAVADALGVGQTTVSQWERTGVLLVSDLMRLLDLYQATADDRIRALSHPTPSEAAAS